MQTTLSDFDLYLFAEGTHTRAYEKLGAHLGKRDGRLGVQFAVWAPNAERVSVIGDFNDWNITADSMRPSSAGVWEGFVPDIGPGAVYKYHVVSRDSSYVVDKADPYGFAAEIRPRTASRVWDLEDYSWLDHSWMSNRANNNSLNSPISIYEVHLGSWKRVPEEAQPLANLPRDGSPSGRLRSRRGLYPCRISPHHGTSLRWFVGISNHRLLCSH